ncbi:MAG: phosphoglycerate kinase [candidate division WOR-3 bacterium]
MNKVPLIKDLNVKNKRVLCRFDFNVPISEGKIEDDTRLRASLPTIRYLMENGAITIMMSHLGRPKGKVVKELSLMPIAKRLSELLGKEVQFIEKTVGPEVEKKVSSLKSGDLLLLENTRFHPEEEKNDKEFSRLLGNLGDVYVNDAFATAHRAHASTYGVAEFIKEKAIGFLMLEEIKNLSKLLENPESPFTVVLGGVKLETKIPVIKNLAPLADNILIGGAMCFSFIHFKGGNVGDSPIEKELLKDVEEAIKIIEKEKKNFLLPEDVVVIDYTKDIKSIPPDVKWNVVSSFDIPKGKMGVDIGEKTIGIYKKIIASSKTLFWNGPLGVFEKPPFDKGTWEIAKEIGKLTEKGGFTVVGGGDTDKVFEGTEISVTHLSTGGGASLEFVGGKELPGIKIIAG